MSRWNITLSAAEVRFAPADEAGNERAMKHMVLLIFVVCWIWPALSLPAQRRAENSPAPYFELYSWKDSKSGQWTFSVFFNTDRNKTAEEVFDKKNALKGLKGLNLKIQGMPRKSHIVWLDRLTFNGAMVKGSERLACPPERVVRKVRDFANSRGIEVIGPPAVCSPKD